MKMLKIDNDKTPVCAKCPLSINCRDGATSPDFCTKESYADVKQESLKENWDNPENKKINSAWKEVISNGRDEGGYKWTRVKEVIEYAKFLKYKKIGLAFCAGLSEEARILNNILEKNGFEVISVVCTSGGTKEDDKEKSIVCNPIFQAEVLNHEKTNLNIMLGLCVGHDVLFIRYSKADVTPLIVKDRVMANNPAGALYSAYQRRRLLPK